MPQFIFSHTFTAGETGFNPLTGWQFEYLPWRALVRIMDRSTTTGLRRAGFSGSTNVIQRSPVQGGGTIGVTPSPLNTPVLEWIGSPGDRVQLLYDEVAAGTPTLDGIISVDPV